MADNAAMGSSTNPDVRQAQDAIIAKVKPEMRDAVGRIIAAGLKIAFDRESHDSLMGQLAQSEDKVHDVAVGAVGLVMVLYQQSKGSMPVEAMPAAGAYLMLEGLDYANKAYDVPIDKNVIGEATHLFIETLMPKLGIDDKTMAEATNKAEQWGSNPAIMSKFQQQSGGQDGNAQ